MNYVLLTQYDGAILGPIAKLLGYLMNAIFIFLDTIGIPNVGLSIIIFTLLIYLALSPLTLKQQKFSKLSAKMNPEIQAIQEKYKGKKDNESMMKMNEETKAVYEKYGTSPTGSCVQLIIQMPILFALYRVIDNVPAYVTKVKEAFNSGNFIEKFVNMPESVDFIKNNFSAANRFSKQFENPLFISNDPEFVKNTFIDVLNKSTTSEWMSIGEKFDSLKEFIQNGSDGAFDLFEKYNSFLGINIVNSPSYYFSEGISSKHFSLIFIAILFPLLAALTQWINTKLMPQPDTSSNQQQSSMASSMKMMNYTMPIMSAVFCFSLPVGMAIYWIAGAVIRSVQQIIFNKHLDKVNIDEVIEKNLEKSKNKKSTVTKTVPSQSISNKARINTKAVYANSISKNNEEKVVKISESSNIKAGSITEKANLVKKYNEFNNK